MNRSSRLVIALAFSAMALGCSPDGVPQSNQQGPTQPPSPSCTYQIVGSNPLPFGQTAIQQATCTNVSFDSKVHVVGTFTAGQLTQPIDWTITLTNGAWQQNYQHIDMQHVGEVVLHLEVRAANNTTVLVKTGDSRLSLLAPNPSQPSCTYGIDGPNPVPYGGIVTEKISCRNLPAGALVVMESYRNEIFQFREPITLTNGNWSNPVTINDPVMAAVYVRHVEIVNSVGVVIFKSVPVSETVLGP